MSGIATSRREEYINSNDKNRVVAFSHPTPPLSI